MILSQRDYWDEISGFLDENPRTCHEIAEISKISKARVIAGIMFARSRGLVEEITLPGHGGGRRVSVYRVYRRKGTAK